MSYTYMYSSEKVSTYPLPILVFVDAYGKKK